MSKLKQYFRTLDKNHLNDYEIVFLAVEAQSYYKGPNGLHTKRGIKWEYYDYVKY